MNSAEQFEQWYMAMQSLISDIIEMDRLVQKYMASSPQEKEAMLPALESIVKKGEFDKKVLLQHSSFNE